MKDLEKLFLGELSDIYNGEQQLLKALNTMAEKAESEELKSCFRDHIEQTKTHVNRLDQVFRGLQHEPERMTCKGLEGIIDEGQIIAVQYAGNSALDAALVSAAQKAEHYEISSYGCLCTWADELGNTQAGQLLRQTLDEEKETDQRLTKVASSVLNVEAMRHDTPKRGETASRTMKTMTSGT